MRSPKKRSLLSVNEYFSGKRNNKRAFLVSLFDIALRFYHLLTLNLLSCIFLQLLLSCPFGAQKDQKARHRQKLLTVTPCRDPHGTNFVCASRDQLLAPLSICCCKFKSRKRHLSVKEGAKAHSLGELKFPSSQTLLARNGAS